MFTFLFSTVIAQVWATIAFGGLMYWLPTIVALSRRSDSRFTIAMLNLGFGWTGIGWICAIVWAIGPMTGHRGRAVLLAPPKYR
jgi:Superinfection immunity protein